MVFFFLVPIAPATVLGNFLKSPSRSVPRMWRFRGSTFLAGTCLSLVDVLSST